MTRPAAIVFALVTLLVLTTSFHAKGAERKVQVSDFGKTTDGVSVYRYVLTNDNGVKAVVVSYGVDLVSLKVPDRNGEIADVVLGYDTIDGYEQGASSFGGAIGRYGNRIASGKFALDGTVFHVPKNDGPISLHGNHRFQQRGLDSGRSFGTVQCGTSLEENLGVVPCTVMSMMGESLLSSACEVDVCGVLGMHALQLASETPSALLDWNNNYADNPNKAVCFPGSNLPKHFFKEVKMDYQSIIAGTVRMKNTFRTCVGHVKAGAMSFARFSTDDVAGRIRGYTGQGKFTDDPLETFGGAGVVEIPGLRKLLRHICENGFEHHVAASFSSAAPAVYEATARYRGWRI